jgi:hypothetical protein
VVDLPKVPRRLATNEAPRSRVSAEVIGAPYAMLGNALGTLGEGIESAGVRIAEDEGRRAVSTGPDGKPVFEAMPAFTGKAGEAYNRVGYSKYMVELQNATENDVLKAREDFRADPEKFREWGAGYVDQLVARTSDDRLKDAVKAQATNVVQQAYRGLSVEKQNRDVETTNNLLVARQEKIENEIISLTQQGDNSSPAYQSKLADRSAIIADRVGNPLFKYTKERADLDEQTFQTKSTAISIVGAVRRTAENTAVDENGKPLGGAVKARELAQSILTDERLNALSPEQRRHFYNLAVSEVRALNTENRVLVNQLSQEANQWRTAINRGEVDPEGVRDFLERATDAGALRAFATVTNAVALNTQLRGWFDRLPPQDRVKVQIELQGQTGSLAQRIVRAESGNDPLAANPASTARGTGQFIESTWLQTIQKHRPDLVAGKSREEILSLRTDPKLSLEMVDALAKDNRASLSAAGVRTDDSALYLAHFLGAGDAIKVLQAHSSQPVEGLISQDAIKANKAVFGKVKTVQDLNEWAAKKVGVPDVPGQVRNNPEFLNAVRARQKKELDTAFPKIEQRINANENVAADEIEQFGALVSLVGTPEQKEKFLSIAVRASAGAQVETMSAQQREQLRTQFAEKFAQGATQLESEIGNFIRTQDERITAAYKDDPYGAAVRYGQRPRTPAVDFSKPETLDAALKAREQEQAWIRQQEGSVKPTLLRPAEERALWGAIMSNDPAVFSPALVVAANLLDRDPHAFATAKNKEEIQKAAVAYRHYTQDLAMSPDQAAQRIFADRDPEFVAKTKARIKNEDIDNIVKKNVTIHDVRGAFDESWWPGTPNIGFTPEMRKEMFGHYVELFRDFYSQNGDIGKSKALAASQLKRNWGVTRVNGSDIVMPFPPEKAPAYAGIENAADLIAEDAVLTIKAETGQDVKRGQLRLMPLPGARTAQAFVTNDAPGYVLGWQDDNGLLHIVNPQKAFVADPKVMRQRQTDQRADAMAFSQRLRDTQRATGDAALKNAPWWVQ